MDESKVPRFYGPRCM